MENKILNYLIILGGSSLKFIWGPVTGPGMGLDVWEIGLFTAAGMMTSVVVVSLLGTKIRDRLVQRARSKKKYRVFTKRKRRIVRIWKRFGMAGVAILTPLLLTPIGGTLIALSFRVPTKKIILYMLVSALAFSFLFAFVLHRGETWLIEYIRH